MRRVVLGGLMLALLATLTACPPAERDPADSQRAADQLHEEYLNAYNQHDAQAVAAFYTTDAILIDADGTELSGRDQIERELESVFAEARPQLTVSPMETEGDQWLGWQHGTYEVQLQAGPAVPPPGQPGVAPQPGQPGQPGQPTPSPEESGMEPPPGEPEIEPQPGTEPQPGQTAPPTTPPGQPGLTPQPGQPEPPGLMPQQPQRIQGRYLIVLEWENERWLIRAHMNNAGIPGFQPMEGMHGHEMMPPGSPSPQPGQVPPGRATTPEPPSEERTETQPEP